MKLKIVSKIKKGADQHPKDHVLYDKLYKFTK